MKKEPKYEKKSGCDQKLVLVLAGAGLLNVAQLSAHHSFAAEFDAKKPVKLRGVVTKMEWINPHAWIHVRCEGSGRQGHTWMVGAGAPHTLSRPDGRKLLLGSSGTGAPEGNQR